MNNNPYTLQQVLKIASWHPSYNSNAVYPPSRHQVAQILDQDGEPSRAVKEFPVVSKEDL